MKWVDSLGAASDSEAYATHISNNPHTLAERRLVELLSDDPPPAPAASEIVFLGMSPAAPARHVKAAVASGRPAAAAGAGAAKKRKLAAAEEELLVAVKAEPESTALVPVAATGRAQRKSRFAL